MQKAKKLSSFLPTPQPTMRLAEGEKKKSDKPAKMRYYSRTERQNAAKPMKMTAEMRAEGEKNMQPIRIQKALSEAGVASRRAAEELVRQGRVTINGRKAEIGQSVNPDRDVIAVDGKRVYFCPEEAVPLYHDEQAPRLCDHPER